MYISSVADIFALLKSQRVFPYQLSKDVLYSIAEEASSRLTDILEHTEDANLKQIPELQRKVLAKLMAGIAIDKYKAARVLDATEVDDDDDEVCKGAIGINICK